MTDGWGAIPLLQWTISNEKLLWWLFALSITTFIATLVAVPWWLARIPPDYFTRPRRKTASTRHPVIRTLGAIGRNLLAFVFILAGILMLVLPGQGILTILVGVMLMNFPGKRRLERWIVSRDVVLHSINWLRRREGKPPLLP
ncbi:MAG: hypothetical protein M0009_08595 [Deltaproteobacteria bacterium]|nr:hypothetical protein [Deltaproteobacteria bacterium]